MATVEAWCSCRYQRGAFVEVGIASTISSGHGPKTKRLLSAPPLKATPAIWAFHTKRRQINLSVEMRQSQNVNDLSILN